MQLLKTKVLLKFHSGSLASGISEKKRQGVSELCIQHLHGNQTGYCGAKVVKDVASREGHEVVHEGANGEDERELFILSSTACKLVRKCKCNP